MLGIEVYENWGIAPKNEQNEGTDKPEKGVRTRKMVARLWAPENYREMGLVHITAATSLLSLSEGIIAFR